MDQYNYLDIAWAAGLFEGEGHISHGRSSRYPEVGLTSTDQDVIIRFANIVCIGNVTGPYQRGSYKPCWKWTAYGAKNVQTLGRLLWYYLGNRRRSSIATAIADYYVIH